MANNLYITATEARSGKSAISLGVMEMLLRKIRKVGFFRPIINVDPQSNKRDDDINLIASHFKLEIPYEQMYGYTDEEANTLISLGKEEELLEGIINAYNALKEHYEFILCEGTDFASSSAAFEFDINAEISKNLGCPVLLVANAYQKTIDDTIQSVELALDSLNEKGCQTIALVINRPDPQDKETLINLLKERDLTKEQMAYAIPNEEFLGKPTVGEVARFVGAEVLYGDDQLNRHVYDFTVAAMQIWNMLTRINYGSLIITPGDRADVIVACLAAVSSRSIEYISGLLLTGGLQPEEPIWKLIKGIPQRLPILSVQENTFPTATLVNSLHAKIAPNDEQKITRALAIFEKNVDVEQLGERVITTRTSFMTPKMFEYGLLQRARQHKQHIVLPEGDEERILQAAEILLRREVVDLTLLGNEQAIREKIAQLGLQLEPVQIIDPLTSDLTEDYAQTYCELRKHKGISLENARDVICDVSFFGAMMVYKRHADGMVSGAVHSTAATIRPALQIIKTAPGCSVVSSVFFMCLDKVLVYGDCAVNTNPNAQQLAEIAISSAQTATTFGIDPVVAMLSYSTGESGRGEDVDKVREATKLAKDRAQDVAPGLLIEGPLQYDAAVDPGVARTKMPDSKVAGKATVFIFPDLNTGNNTYKAVQRSAGVVAIGPVLQGLKYPVNDLSRGCTIPDIVNTVVITAIQAQAGKGL
ncbi:phosphate acetyltransferase [candidate division KSB3 bacterium]|uniref:Phosphate acetyltransferase n=1 Tax=candidate division KSB3 bacterium TaxID=2044937 RepID=A0A9D5Q608_9BACT|nr:phosphate acetyltransferase [candidate division KSB3 bacterium]MBD3324792.1 phosphate acetyltransferase [candidate division KSB3 bacterium]